MKTSATVTALASLVGGLAVVASLTGLFWQQGDGRTAVTSIRGERVELYGEGLYRHDTVFIAAGSRGTDAATLALAVPLLVVAVALYRRDSVRGALLLAGAFAYFLYVYASRSLGNAYNGLFLVYIVLFSASLFGMLLTISRVNTRALAASPLIERAGRGLALFLFAAGLITTFVWLTPLLAAVAQGEAPKLLDTYTTNVTESLDLGVLVPTVFIAATLVYRRAVAGYVVACVLLVLLVLVAATIVLGTVFQVAADVSFTPGEIVGPIAGFLVLAAIALWLLMRLLRAVADAGPEATAR